MRAASSEPIARPRPKPPSSLRVRPRWKRSKISSRSSAGTPGPGVGDLDRRLALRPADPDLDCRIGGRDAQGVVEQDAHDPRDATRVGLRPGLAVDLARGRARRVAPSRAASNSAATARAVSPSSTGSLRSSSVASRRLRSSRSEARPARRRDCSCARRDPLAGVGEVDRVVGEVVGEQLEHAVERRQRRAQLVRGGRDESASRVLLLAQARVHRREARAPARRSHRETMSCGSDAACRGRRSSRLRLASAGARSRRSSREESAMPSSTATADRRAPRRGRRPDARRVGRRRRSRRLGTARRRSGRRGRSAAAARTARDLEHAAELVVDVVAGWQRTRCFATAAERVGVRSVVMNLTILPLRFATPDDHASRGCGCGRRAV